MILIKEVVLGLTRRLLGLGRSAGRTQWLITRRERYFNIPRRGFMNPVKFIDTPQADFCKKTVGGTFEKYERYEM